MGILKYGLNVLKLREISLPHAESIFNVLGKTFGGILTDWWVTRSQGLNEDDCIWS